MAAPKRRVKLPPKRTSKKTTTNKTRVGKTRKRSGAFDRGSSGFAKARKQQAVRDAEYERKKNTPFSFWLPPGEQAEVVILDKGDPFFVKLHRVKREGRWEDEVCIADTGERCPLCESLGKEGSFTMVLTVLDRRPYTIKNGPNKGKTVKVSKKLFYVKGRNLPKFERNFEGKANHNFRGVKVLCHRTAEKEAGIGEDLEFLGRLKEASLEKYGDNAVAADYEKIFALPTADELRLRYNLKDGGGGGRVAGSDDFQEGDGDDYDAEEVDW